MTRIICPTHTGVYVLLGILVLLPYLFPTFLNLQQYMRVSDNSSDAIMIISSSGSMMAASVETVQLLVFVAVLGPSVVVGDSVTVKVNVVMTVVIKI